MGKIGVLLYTLAQIVALVFAVVGTPIEMFRFKHEVDGDTPCVTLWGIKNKCSSTSYDVKVDDDLMFLGCSSRQDHFKAAEAFAIISICIIAGAAAFGFIQCCCCVCCQFLLYLLNICTIATLCIAWALMANVYNSNSDKSVATVMCHALKDEDFKYGAGFALLVVAWCIVIIDMIFLKLPC